MIHISSVTPASLIHPGLAMATARAGGTGILDFELCTPVNWLLARANFRQLVQASPFESSIGLRLRADQLSAVEDLLELVTNRQHWLVLTAWATNPLPSLLAGLQPALARKLVLEIIDQDQLGALPPGIQIDALLVKGHECGGWVGDSPAFILAQQILEKTELPIHVQGGIGPQTAAACHVGGAAGVVLDDQLWLMPESPLPRDWKAALTHLNGSETITPGESFGQTLRVLHRPGFSAAAKLRELGEAMDISGDTTRWSSEANAWLGWDSPDRTAWPMGQAVGLAALFAKTHHTAGRLIQGIIAAVKTSVLQAREYQPLAPDSALARSHQTHFPIIQGPMTRVSDVEPFANAVSKAGALPMLALALMRAPAVEKLLLQCHASMEGASWGVGILGFVPTELRQEQLAVVEKIKPPFALIAGGQPEQAQRLEKAGIATYLHVPTGALLDDYIARGSRRFIFEGRECGGHVGPLSSFTLWETMIQRLLAIPANQSREMHLIFAGGIHDARTGAMISALAAPLAAKGMKIGVLMGTAYLFTQEAVEFGAICTTFQQEAVQCTRTTNLETRPGHASRCVVTPFASEFNYIRRKMQAEKVPPEEISQHLEELTLGRLRIASKGIVRRENEMVPVDEAARRQKGMYMIGQAATLRTELCSVAELHLDVSEVGAALLESLEIAPEPSPTTTPSDIAIIGIGVLLPGAHNPEDFWKNIIGKVNQFREIPPERWDWRLYYDADRSVRDRTNSKWGAFLDEVSFDPLSYGIPPAILKSIEPLQLLALEATRRALEDAGYGDGNFDKENTSVILGHSGGMSDLGQQIITRGEMKRMIGPAGNEGFDRLPEYTDETFPGILPNVTSGRVANRFGCAGANFTVDAACASSLTSLDLATRELETGRCNLAIAGGIDTLLAPGPFLCFAKTNALSSQGILRTFDEAADGIVIGEGAGIVILKRLADAERDGDKIYAVIKGVGSSSDGRSASMTAPASDGQMKAFRRAYDKAGFPISTLGFYEAHGTGTPVGDRIELTSVVKFQARSGGQPKTCATGSVKSLIGHTKANAGVAGVIKTALALYHKVLPPHHGVDKPLKRLRDPKSPLYLLKEASPWITAPGQARRAGISAFGFGGTNFHVVLEEYAGSLRGSAQGGDAWPCELFLWQSADAASLQKELADFKQAVALGTEIPLRNWACSLTGRLRPDWKISLGIVASSTTELLAEIDNALAEIKTPGSVRFSINTILQTRETIPAVAPKIAFLFPGQGSQYVNMGRETALYFPEMLDALIEGNAAFEGQLGKNLSQFIFPPATFSPEEQKEVEQQLSATQIAQPGIGVLSCAYLDLLRQLGVGADFYAGHSYGEYTALHAAGVLSRETFLHLSGVRGKVMASACDGAPGAMAAVKALREDILNLVQDERIVVANHNAPRQTVISGPVEAILEAIAKLEAAKISVRQLPVAGAFHSPLMQHAQGPLSQAIAEAEVLAPQGVVYSNTHAQPYEADPAAIRARLSGHMLASVEFVSEINAIYAAGARVFIEVGPRNILTGLAREILKDQPDATMLALDTDRGNLRGLLRGLAQLAAAGVTLDWRIFFERRDCQTVDLTPRHFAAKPNGHDGSMILVSGGSIRKAGEARGLTGIKPHLNLDTTTPSEAKIVSAPPGQEPKAQKMNANTQPADSPSAQATPVDGAVQAYWTYQETMRQFLKMQEQVMVHFLSGSAAPGLTAPLPSSAPSLPMPVARTVAPAAAPAPKPASAPVAEAPKTNGHAAPAPASPNGISAKHEGPIDRETLTAELLRLVSERTGYPTEVLGLEQDMESELGIDSIKRVEIFGALQSQLPSSLTARIPEGGEDFTRVRTLKGWVDALMSLPA